MPDLPWSSDKELEAGATYVVLASLLHLKRISSTVTFFRAAQAVRRQLAAAHGLVAYTLRAKPLAGDYWTLSVWTDQSALREFVSTLPHAQVMGSLKPIMGATRFAQWEITSDDGRPAWPVALEHLDSA